MAIIQREIKMICADVGVNANKFWYGRLFDNGDVQTEWGRVGKNSQSKMFPSAGESFLEKKKKEKENGGYSELRVVSGATGGAEIKVGSSQLNKIASEQIKTGSPLADKLIKQLIAWNVHQITSSTNITYNDATGLFQTPLGVVSQDAIDEARGELSLIQDFVKGKDWKSKKIIASVNKYLRLIPQDIGMRFELERIFPDDKAVQSQAGILDSLEASLKALASNPKTDGDKKEIIEKVFDVEMGHIDEKDAEFARINKWYKQTANSVHACYGMDMKSLYTLKVGHIHDAFQQGKKVGNVRELWHGTNKANLLSIMKTGLKCSPPSTAKIAGKMFGNGVYFSDQSTKSLNYAYGYWHGGQRDNNCFMLVCEVAMGKEYTPSSGGWGSHYPIKGYDSTFAQAGKSGVSNNEMIVYQNNQINMKYLVEFSK